MNIIIDSYWRCGVDSFIVQISFLILVMSLFDFLSHVKHDIYFILPNEWIEGLLYNPKCYLMISQIIEQYIISYCNMFIVLSICVQVTVLCSKL